MDTSLAKKLASTLGVGSLLLGTALVAGPAASAAPPVTTAASASAPGTSSTALMPQAAGPRTALVNAWYWRFLYRDAEDDPGARYWVEQLRTVPPADVLTQLLRTREYVLKEVNRSYEEHLGRSVDGSGGEGYWVRGVMNGQFPLEWVEQNVLASPEHVSRAGQVGGAGAVVRSWYADILQRTELRPGEEQYWTARLAQTSPLQVVREIWYSSEAVNLRIEDHYYASLGRGPDAAGLGYWYGQEVASDARVQILIASSPEAQAIASRYYG